MNDVGRSSVDDIIGCDLWNAVLGGKEFKGVSDVVGSGFGNVGSITSVMF